MKITIIGAGRLGSPMAAVFASAGHTVYCVDTNEQYVHAIKHRQAPVKGAPAGNKSKIEITL